MDTLIIIPVLPKETQITKPYLKALHDSTHSDGCTGVPDFYLDCCVIHDLAYKYGIDPWGQPVTRAEADAGLRKCIQQKSKLRWFSPMSWWRYAGVRLFGGQHYTMGKREGEIVAYQEWSEEQHG